MKSRHILKYIEAANDKEGGDNTEQEEKEEEEERGEEVDENSSLASSVHCSTVYCS